MVVLAGAELLDAGQLAAAEPLVAPDGALAAAPRHAPRRETPHLRLVTEPARQTEPKLTVIIPATNEPPTLAACLAAVEAADEPPEEVVVVTDPELALAQARNAGAARAQGDLLVFLDADVLVHPDCFSRIRKAFAENDGLSAVFGSYDDCPPSPGVVSGFRNLFHYHVHQQAAGCATTFWTGLGAVDRESFLALGGFNGTDLCWPRRETLGGDFMADVCFGMRLTSAGHGIRLDPAIQGTHLKRWSLGSMVRTDFFARGVPWTRLLLRDGHIPAMMNLGWRHRLSSLASSASVLALGCRRPRTAGLLALSLVPLNSEFYGLMLRRRGPKQTCAAVGCHIVYHLTAVLSLITGLVLHLGEHPSDTD